MIISSNWDKQSIVIPPHRSSPSTWFKVTSHLPPTCIDSKGFTIINVLLHAHGAARTVKLRHFRDGEELPWIIYDDFYDSEYQQFRNLDTPVKVLPGDHLMVECEYGSEKEIAVAEMCAAVLHLSVEDNTRPKFLRSQSWVDEDRLMRLLGITNQTTVFDGEHLLTTIHEPSNLAGELKKILSHKFVWTSKILKKFQDMYVYGPQHQLCGATSEDQRFASRRALKTDSVSTPLVGILNPYIKPKVCKPSVGNSDMDGDSISPSPTAGLIM